MTYFRYLSGTIFVPMSTHTLSSVVRFPIGTILFCLHDIHLLYCRKKVSYGCFFLTYWSLKLRKTRILQLTTLIWQSGLFPTGPDTPPLLTFEREHLNTHPMRQSLVQFEPCNRRYGSFVFTNIVRHILYLVRTWGRQLLEHFQCKAPGTSSNVLWMSVNNARMRSELVW